MVSTVAPDDCGSSKPTTAAALSCECCTHTVGAETGASPPIFPHGLHFHNNICSFVGSQPPPDDEGCVPRAIIVITIIILIITRSFQNHRRQPRLGQWLPTRHEFKAPFNNFTQELLQDIYIYVYIFNSPPPPRSLGNWGAPSSSSLLRHITGRRCASVLKFSSAETYQGGECLMKRDVEAAGRMKTVMGGLV